MPSSSKGSLRLKIISRLTGFSWKYRREFPL